MSVSTFLTVSGILTAVLLVWAQLWWRTYNERQKNYASVGLGILWSYLAVLISLVSFSWSAILSVTGANTVPEPVANLFKVALFIGGLNILQSTVSVIVKLLKGANITESLMEDYIRRHLRLFTLLSIAAGILAFLLPLTINSKDVTMPSWEFWVGMLFPLTVAVVALVIALRDSPRIRRIEDELTSEVDLDIRWAQSDKPNEVKCFLSALGDDLTQVAMELPYLKDIGEVKRNIGFNAVFPDLKRGMRYRFTFKDGSTLRKRTRAGVIRF